MFEQERLIGRLQRRTMSDPDITACFLSGSFGRRADDAYSDLDVVLVYLDEPTLGRAWRNRVEFAKSIMPYNALKSFDAEHIRSHFHIVLFANGSKLDLRFAAQDSIVPNPWDSHIRILKDTNGWAEAFQLKCSQQALPQPGITNHKFTLLDQRFWVMYWDILRLLARGDADKPFPIFLELMHVTLPPLLLLLPQDVPARTKLIEAHYGQDARITVSYMKSLMHAYIAARSAIIEQYHLPYTADLAFETQIQRLVDKFT